MARYDLGNAKYSARFQVLASDPITASEGDAIINSTTGDYKIWYDGSWHILHNLAGDMATFDFMDGTDFLFMDGSGFNFMDA